MSETINMIKKVISNKYGFLYSNSYSFASFEAKRVFTQECDKAILRRDNTPVIQWPGMDMYQSTIINSDFIMSKLYNPFDLKLSIQNINPVIGNGLFAGVNIKKYGIIGNYSGKVMLEKDDSVNSGYIMCCLFPECEKIFYIDSKDTGNLTRFVNHSDNPNVGLVWAFRDGLWQVLFVAAEDIKKGDQFTINYGDGYWRGKRAVKN